MKEITREILEQYYCWEEIDNIPGEPEVTAFKRRARLKQALWREGKGIKIGTKKDGKRIGSRIDMKVAREKNANFLNEDIIEAVKQRMAEPQKYQTLNEDRLYCNLLSSMPMCFNLFGDLQRSPTKADYALHTWWPDVPGKVCEVHFEWSPGRREKGRFLENRSAFDVAFELNLEDGRKGVVGIETKYHEDCKKEKVPSEDRQRRYIEVTEKSEVIKTEAIKEIIGNNIQQIWLDHILALSMPQTEPNKWGWVGFMLVYPEKNPSYARAAENYRRCLKNERTFKVKTIESLLEENVIPKETISLFRERYLW